MEPTGAGSRRRWWPAALAVLGVVVVAGVAAVVVSSRTKAPAPTSCAASPTKRTGVTSPATGTPAGGGLRVVEQGFSQVGTGGGSVSLGAMVENPTALVAYRARVTLRVFDAQHQSAVPPSSGELLRQEIPVIMPGQRIGVGAWTYVREASPGRRVTVSSLEVELGATQWWPRDNDVHIFAPISTHHQRTERSSAEPESGTITYSAESGYCRELTPRGVATVFRNGGGTVVGGSFWLDKSREQCLPGTSTHSVQALVSIPPAIDDGKTESYPYCDSAPGDAGAAGPDRPIN